MKITDKGTATSPTASIVPKDALEQVNAQIEALGGEPAKGHAAQAGHGQHALLGITKAAVQSSSFISAASFQETTKVLTAPKRPWPARSTTWSA